MNGTVTIDKAGRLVVPKTIRDALHLEPGTTLELEQKEDSIVLRHPRAGSELAKKDGMWVIRNNRSLNYPISDLIEQHREERIQELVHGYERKAKGKAK